jgi:hypothetical protein
VLVIAAGLRESLDGKRKKIQQSRELLLCPDTNSNTVPEDVESPKKLKMPSISSK